MKTPQPLLTSGMKNPQNFIHWQRMQRIFGRKTEGSKKEEGKKRFLFPIKKEKDPNMLDVDMMTTDE